MVIIVFLIVFGVFFFQAEDGIRDLVRSRGLGDVYKRQIFSPIDYQGFKIICYLIQILFNFFPKIRNCCRQHNVCFVRYKVQIYVQKIKMAPFFLLFIKN